MFFFPSRERMYKSSSDPVAKAKHGIIKGVRAIAFDMFAIIPLRH